MVRILGISASLRNARFGKGSDALVADLASITDRPGLIAYLRQHTQFRLDDFLAAGRSANRPFDQIYAGLRRLRGERGLSNSEAALAAALWAAGRAGCEIRHRSLAEHFPMHGNGHDLEGLKREIEAADALIVSGPVYFGDRGSLAQSLIEFIAADPALRQACRGKIYAGVAVGAKRNGGQETTLIYQMLDMVNLDFLAVGNSSQTTSQYGGTAVAGDVGKLHSDEYGIETSIGTGERAAQAAQMLHLGRTSESRLRDPLRVHLWLLQDDVERHGRQMFGEWAERLSADTGADVKLLDIAGSNVVRCIACDICPTHVGPQEEYRCIISAADDFFVRHHREILSADAIMMCAYSPRDRGQLISAYQQFIERTRYLRRDNYALTDLLAAPFVISELSARQNLHLRMLTSIVRHNTVLHHPIIGMVHDGKLLNGEQVMKSCTHFIATAEQATIGRYQVGHRSDLVYNPVGYEISARKAEEDQASGRTRSAMEAVARRSKQAARDRISTG